MHLRHDLSSVVAWHASRDCDTIGIDWQQQQQAAHPLPVSTPPALEVRRFHWPYIHPISLGEHPMSPAGTSSLGPEASEHDCELL